MSELTKRLREQLTMSKFTNRAYLYARMDDDRRVAADRIEALEECLREVMDGASMAIDVRYDYGRFRKACEKARAMLEEK